MLRECLGMILAFGFLIFVPKRGLWEGVLLLLTALILGLAAGQAPWGVWENFTDILTSLPTLRTIIVILQIGILSALMKHYGVLSGLNGALQNLFSSPKVVMMLLPAVFGMLSVPGGAQLSSPFVHQLGEELDLPVEKRAAVNLTFRHMAYFLLPTSSSMIVFSNLAPHISLYQLIALNFAFIFLMELTSFLLFLRGAKGGGARGAGGRRLRGLWDIVRYLSPICLILILNGLFKVGMDISVFVSLMMILLFRGRGDVRDYWRVFRSGFSFKTLVMMLAICFMQNTVRDLTAIMGAFQSMFAESSGLSVLLTVAAAALLFGMTTGLSYVPLGVLVPLLTALGLPPTEELIYGFFTYAWAFTGYFFSPLHLCQVLTLSQMECRMRALDRACFPLMCEMALSSFVLFGLYRRFLL